MKKAFFVLTLAFFAIAAGFIAKADAPLAPADITVTSASTTSINFSWATSTGAVGYEIYRNSTSTPIATTALLNYADTGLAPLTLYNYYFRAYDASNTKSVFSNVVATTTLADSTKPTMPGNLAAVPYSSSQINLSWTASTDNVSVAGYRIYRDNVLTATTSNLTYQNTGLSTSTIYNFTVSAYDAAGNESDKTGIVSASTVIDTVKPTIPGNLSAVPYSQSQINLSWTAATDNVSVAGYRIYRDNVLTVTTPNLTYSDIGLSTSTTYNYSISAYDGTGNESARTATATAKTLANAQTATSTNANVAIFNSGKQSKTINVRSNGIIKIVVYTNSAYKAKDIKNNTVLFGGAKAIGWTLKDVNHDKKLDRIYSFRARQMKDLRDGDTTAQFSAKLKNGATISATLSVKVLNAPKKKNNTVKIEKKIANIKTKFDEIKVKTENKIIKLQEKINNTENQVVKKIENLQKKENTVIEKIKNNSERNNGQGGNKNEKINNGKKK